ncbi:hypothetical protein BCIN_01g07410 [Botrytis cinerea B05.10]|uniref:Uncharacterized protein n=1 Tax=Botryotinia fuckeliana (strain B05.10) TaxID=332648 RepID=A0A384J6A9_BOTFB|nr:hypothetical protein BCIN_01g07410 [Botrytis cinerea B05.10]ATZ46069.1 hypothetical protein BCIN_01g07410 [Botrytis cinerea B05.10]
MSSNANSNNGGTTPPNESSSRPRRGSITAQTFTNIFRSNSTSAGGPVGPFPGPVSTGASHDHKRRMSISTLGLSGASPTQSSAFPFGGRRGSVSTTASESIDESAIDDEDGPSRGTPTTPFARRMSFGAQALRTVRTGNGSPGTNGEGGFNWSEQLRSRAESQVSQSQRPIMSTSPPNNQRFNVPMHERAKSIGDAPAPPTSAIPPVAAPKPARKQPDAFQERILKGDFYMD